MDSCINDNEEAHAVRADRNCNEMLPPGTHISACAPMSICSHWCRLLFCFKFPNVGTFPPSTDKREESQENNEVKVSDMLNGPITQRPTPRILDILRSFLLEKSKQSLPK